ncbi:MAG: 3-isopropylmalate dehydratase large subunit [Candidatus Omnitrophica bacterium CG08_land_8_20_14_0_20_41_16]|uniref:3-isopropylmalate dehydratase large subunit n=1 Tax=Candidatus Sherwoodlollariibacterium unditelluris TaxID=1974757 RepID=A0A2G9YJ50_9BACT|nr:MAG: 3-isopropylmalate dehydratase large subunit [Candidatus Omnitrophica bacterium CG23_combo_of_CG06-09_8_20_14_all_41_10]PIS33684.1 MAG: 3-isopropylmalate dehydratase large subunit [Candidatus Omnitrophica bacterium CG08_land_8_20_14_0_20_41_16]
MAYTIAEKILLAHTDKQDIKLGEFIEARVDAALGNDITAPVAIEEFKKAGFKQVFDKTKIVLVPDHFAPAKDLRSANQCKALANFAKEQGIVNYFEVGRMGIEHALLPEKGLVLPGDLVIGADSHTCTYGALGCYSTGVGSTDLARSFVDGKVWLKVPGTIKFIFRGKLNKWVGGKDLILFTIGKIGVDGALYKVMEFSGPVIRKLGMDDRFTMSNMAIEAGGRAGIIEPDGITFDYVKRAHSQKVIAHSKRLRAMSHELRALKSDPDASYEKIYEWDVTALEPQVACPHLPSNVKPASELRDIRLDQVVIGSCTNGRLSDLRIAARILKGKKAAPGVKLIVFPATQKIYLQAVKEGLVEIFVKAGGVFSTPTCGPCLGGHMGILAEGETCIATTNRNFIGRMGSPKSFIYLSNPAVAAASAITGRITHPEEI